MWNRTLLSMAVENVTLGSVARAEGAGATEAGRAVEWIRAAESLGSDDLGSPRGTGSHRDRSGKRSSQAHGAKADGSVVLRRKLKPRGKMLSFLASQPLVDPAGWELCEADDLPQRAGLCFLGIDLGVSLSLSAACAVWESGRVEWWHAASAKPDPREPGPSRRRRIALPGLRGRRAPDAMRRLSRGLAVVPVHGLRGPRRRAGSDGRGSLAEIGVGEPAWLAASFGHKRWTGAGWALARRRTARTTFERSNGPSLVGRSGVHAARWRAWRSLRRSSGAIRPGITVSTSGIRNGASIPRARPCSLVGFARWRRRGRYRPGARASGWCGRLDSAAAAAIMSSFTSQGGEA